MSRVTPENCDLSPFADLPDRALLDVKDLMRIFGADERTIHRSQNLPAAITLMESQKKRRHYMFGAAVEMKRGQVRGGIKLHWRLGTLRKWAQP